MANMKTSAPFQQRFQQFVEMVDKAKSFVSVKPRRSLGDLVQSYGEESVHMFSEEEWERLGAYFEMEGDLNHALACYKHTKQYDRIKALLTMTDK